MSSSTSSEEVCLIDDKLGFLDPKNVYQCKKPLKCCVQYQAPSCCGSHSAIEIIKQQLLLWGGLFAILLTIAILFYCRNNDIQIPALIRLRNALARFCCGTSATTISDNRENDKELGFSMKTLTIEQRESFEQPLRVTSSKKNIHSGWRNNAVGPVNQSQL